MRQYPIVFFAALALLIPTIAWGLGADHRSGAIDNNQWPKGLAALVSGDNRVHGFFVNETDILFFRGDALALNTFLTKYSELLGTKLQLVLHPGKLEVKSPWDKQPRKIAADWKLYAAPYEEGGAQPKSGEFVTRVDVWLGGSVKLEELRVPANVTVKSGGEIEAFVKEHAKAK
jgi:hypothetical protein